MVNFWFDLSRHWRILGAISGMSCYAKTVAAEASQHAIKGVSSNHLMHWSIGLIAVLILFFMFIWVIKKIGVIPGYQRENMKVISAITLGMREKLLLVEVGEKQLVLGITPGSINNLLVLEGDERLMHNDKTYSGGSEFSQKLKQLMSGSNHA